ncbi:MAG: ABC-F family ATP-binding cassette domain-containing protein [Verrucomicrobia bacterium]|nr:ABC-F family ATP-binding cassette domain-containing protein [Verrucomicrobiota bacterium]
MLTLSQVTKSYAGRVLFEDAALQVNVRDRIGLIGPNGAGKSTLFGLLLGHDEPDDGVVVTQRGTRVGYLPQETASVSAHTVMELAAGPEADGRAEAMAKRILSGLAFREGDFHRPLRELSGGWIMRAHLARLLVEEPDLLLLDEPTNHLDLETLGWFQNHLSGYPGAILAISHDREFLNLICKGIVEIRHRKLVRYHGNYDACLEQKKAREEQHLAAYRNQQREIAHLESFINRFRAKASKAAQAQDRIKQLARMERIEAPESDEATVHFRFPQPPRGGQRAIALKGVKQAYGEHVVYENLDLEVERGQRTVLVGPNGAGKSTLLKILGGLVELSGGERVPGHNCSIGYFAQHRAEGLDAKRSILAEVQSIARPVPEQAARTVLGAFLFRGDDVFKPIGVLSGGEKSRVALVKLLLDPPNFLLLDEPTTHLDMPSIDALINALKPYEGTIFFVSHDVHFIRAIATSVIHVQAGTLTPYAGGYEYFREKTQAVGGERAATVASLGNFQPDRVEEKSSEGPKLGLKEIKAQRRAEAEARKAESAARRAIEKRAIDLEREIYAMENRQRELTAILESPGTYENPGLAMETNRELAGVGDALEKANADWMAAQAELQAKA